MDILLGSLLIKETRNYDFYNKIVDIVKIKKPNPTNCVVDTKFFKKYLLKELSSEEIKIWIRNVFSENPSVNNDGSDSEKESLIIKKEKKTKKTYYIPLELEDIPRDKIFKWVCYNLYFKSSMQISKIELSEAEIVLHKLEKKLKFKFNQEGNSNIYFLKFGENKIESAYRPTILVYLLKFLKNLCYLSLTIFGFKKNKVNNMIYYQYIKKDEPRKTVFFIHGFGFGIEPYLYYILRLKEKYNLIVLILPNISNMEYLSFTNKIEVNKLFPEHDNWRDMIKSLLIKHNIIDFNFIAHSFGTIIMGILLKDPLINARVSKKIFIEPVCFIDKAYKTFRYINEPQLGNYGLISKVFNIIIYRDIFLRYITQRFLYGPEFWITDYEGLSGNSMVILSEKDQVVPSDNIYEKMKQHNVHSIMMQDAFHADIFMSNKHDNVFDEINNFIDKDDLENINMEDID